MKHRLQELIEQHGKKHWSRAAKKDTDFMAWVHAETIDMPEDTEFAIRVYSAVSGTRPECINGKIRTQLINVVDGWRFCGKGNDCLCAQKSREKKNKNFWQNIDPDEKARILNQQKATLLINHSVTNAGLHPNAIMARKEFYEDPENIKIQNENYKNSMLEFYGVSNGFNLPSVNEYRKNLANLLGSERLKEAAAKRSLLAKSGSFLDKSYEKIVEKFQELGYLTLTPREDYLGVGQTGFRHKYEFMCQRCELKFLDRIYDGHAPSCPKCEAPKFNKNSLEQRSVAEFIEGLGIDFIVNTKKLIAGMEIDIQIPSLKIAIEYGGLYWHSSRSGKDRYYHYRKMKACEAIGYRLITIFSDEWITKREICKNRLISILKKNPEKPIFQRKTKVIEVSSKDASKFLLKHHIQGNSNPSNTILGLTYENELVSIMSFGPLRGTNNHDLKPGYWEIYRFASSKNVAGGASKLFNEFVRRYNPLSVITFCDRRWGTGNVYEKIGFILDGETKPGFFWVEDYKIRYNRSKFTRKILTEQGYDPNLAVEEIMKQRGFDIIWDCGHFKYIWNKK